MIYRQGVTTLEEKRVGPCLKLKLRIPAKIQPRTLAKNLRAAEKKLPQSIFHNILIEPTKDESWKQAYQKYLRPFDFPSYPATAWPLRIDPVGPYPKKPRLNILIIPGQLAFGTGHHPSTQLTGYLMQKAMAQTPVTALLDVGSGTGILAMVARRRGLRDIVAVENDPEARRVARDNFRGNKIRGIQLLERLSATRRRYPLIVANLIATTLIELKADLVKHLQNSGGLILGGLNYRDVPEIHKAYRGFRLRERLNNKGWCALWLEPI